MNAVGLARATAAIAYPTAQSRFAAARKHIEGQPCIKPLGTLVWTTVETGVWRNDRWRDMTNGVFWLVGE